MYPCIQVQAFCKSPVEFLHIAAYSRGVLACSGILILLPTLGHKMRASSASVLAGYVTNGSDYLQGLQSLNAVGGSKKV